MISRRVAGRPGWRRRRNCAGAASASAYAPSSQPAGHRDARQLRAQVAAPARVKRDLFAVCRRVVAVVARVEVRPLPDHPAPAPQRQPQLLLDPRDARARQVVGARLAPRRVLPLDQIVDPRAEQRRPAGQAQPVARAIDRDPDVGVRALLGHEIGVAQHERRAVAVELDKRRDARVAPDVRLGVDLQRRPVDQRSGPPPRAAPATCGTRPVCPGGTPRASRRLTASCITSMRADGMKSRSRPSASGDRSPRPRRPRAAAPARPRGRRPDR